MPLPSGPLPDELLRQASATTLSHYAERAEAFRDGTWNHDVSQNIDALLRHIEGPAPYQVLDFGCGPGRDLRTFSKLGHTPTGLDGCAQFVEMARQASGCEVWQQNFLDLKLPAEHFDGVFANAVLFHIPSQQILGVLRQLSSALKPGGVLFSSNPRGNDEEGWNGDRYGVYYSWETWRGLLTQAGFVELEHYYRPEGLPRDQQPWLASVWRRS
ncbi:Methyltransferase domain-containing protein [Halopseudomonas xinjiangensis]|uniref:Methyltransferase domain-containing protein n=1 Tax=Halopseudomonas xinjiangensis TaxID=487184 RepID=A0A1H1TC42_9GAMM|nr:class I SAM-dependent methyltransferase [Halopseudomonas xinjiangensis]SDS57885.1 Methyltransferase domain-containing protein [Halopseudomonas xinjiangensis]